MNIAWRRLAQHGLSPRLECEAFVEVASRVYGIHAQVMSAAELALGARKQFHCSQLRSIERSRNGP